MTEAGHRIFVAVALHPALRDGVRTLERRLEEAGVTPRWIVPENLHFTLRFLGRISPAQLTRVVRAARDTAAGTAPFQISLSGVGAFPTTKRPRVVWVGIADGAPALEDLARRLDDALAQQRFAKEPRHLQPHLTLARVRDPRQADGLEAAAASLGAFEIGRQDVSSIVVMESHLRPSGALYIPVEEVPLLDHEK
jgi:2'-5' RNA ligase